MMNRRWALLLVATALTACGKADDEGRSDGSRTSADAIAPTSASDARASDPGTSGHAQRAPAAFAVCASCHATQAGGNTIGPTLAGVFDRKAGTVPGYAYSAPLKASGITWNRESLDTWLKGPMAMVPGTRMVIGIGDPQGRKMVIDYLETLK